MYIDNIKLFAKNEKERETYTNKKNIQSGYRKTFGIEKRAMFIMKSRKRQITEGIELLNQERIRTLGEKENYMYLDLLGADTIKWMVLD